MQEYKNSLPLTEDEDEEEDEGEDLYQSSYHCKNKHGGYTKFLRDQYYERFVICVGLETNVIGYVSKNWKWRTREPKVDVYYKGSWYSYSGFQFNRQFTTFIKNSRTVFVDEEERNDFLQVVLNCQYVWDQCIANYCNKYQKYEKKSNETAA